MKALRIFGEVVGGLGVIAYVIGWACWLWLSGATWRRDPPRRYVSRAVRATAQTGMTLAVLGLAVAPWVTVWTLASMALSLFGSAAVWRFRQHLDRRVVVRVGEPIRNPAAGPGNGDASGGQVGMTVRPVEPSEARARASATGRLLRELEAAG